MWQELSFLTLHKYFTIRLLRVDTDTDIDMINEPLPPSHFLPFSRSEVKSQYHYLFVPANANAIKRLSMKNIFKALMLLY